MFCNVKPYVVVTRGLRGRRLQDSVAQAMHYVVGPKSSGVFRFTDLEPIQDACATLHDLRCIISVPWSEMFLSVLCLQRDSFPIGLL
jgi:hypothetical protein